IFTVSTEFFVSSVSATYIAAIGPLQAGTGGSPPATLACPRMLSARAQPMELVSHDPLLKPATKTRDGSTHNVASTAARVASKYWRSGVSAASWLKQLPTAPLSPTRMASFIEAICSGIGDSPLAPQP